MQRVKIEIDYQKILDDVKHNFSVDDFRLINSEREMADDIYNHCVVILKGISKRFNVTLVTERNLENGRDYFYFKNDETKDKILQIPYVHEVI